MKKLLILLYIVSGSVTAQTLVTKTKPLLTGWSPTDFASVEVRVKGRLSTDPATTHKIIGRIMLKGLDISMLTQRVTILVPANQTWEVKSLSANFTPLNTTGIGAYEIPLLPFATSYFPPPGKVLAIDADAKTGNVLLGPVVPLPPVLPPPPPAVILGVTPSPLTGTFTQGTPCTLPFTVANSSTMLVTVTWADNVQQLLDLIPKAHQAPVIIPASGSTSFALTCDSSTKGKFGGVGTITSGPIVLSLPISWTVQ